MISIYSISRIGVLCPASYISRCPYADILLKIIFFALPYLFGGVLKNFKFVRYMLMDSFFAPFSSAADSKDHPAIRKSWVLSRLPRLFSQVFNYECTVNSHTLKKLDFAPNDSSCCFCFNLQSIMRGIFTQYNSVSGASVSLPNFSPILAAYSAISGKLMVEVFSAGTIHSATVILIELVRCNTFPVHWTKTPFS